MVSKVKEGNEKRRQGTRNFRAGLLVAKRGSHAVKNGAGSSPERKGGVPGQGLL